MARSRTSPWQPESYGALERCSRHGREGTNSPDQAKHWLCRAGTDDLRIETICPLCVDAQVPPCIKLARSLTLRAKSGRLARGLIESGCGL
jgi:hypothetical protein